MKREIKTYSVSALARKAGVGDRKTWRKIIEKDRYSQEFTITKINETRVQVETKLGIIELVAIYNDYLEHYIKERNQKQAELINSRRREKSLEKEVNRK